MDQENLARFKEEQPNSAPRMEMLIVMEYLKEYAYDKEHATTQMEIVKFAEEKYNTKIRRDRIGQILIHLEQVSNDLPELLPFTIKSVDFNKIKKYYVPQRMFKESDIVDIVSSLDANDYLPKAKANLLANRFLSVTANKADHERIIKKIQRRGHKTIKVDDESLSKRQNFLNAADNQIRITFKIKNMRRAHFSETLPENVRREARTNPDYSFWGFAVKTVQPEAEPKPIVYLDQYQIAMITSFDNIEITDVESTSRWKEETLSYPLVGKYSNIDDWIKDYYKGQAGKTMDITLKVTTNDEAWFNKFKASFKKHWKKDLEYEIVDREVPFLVRGEDGKPVRKVDIAHDAVFTINTTKDAFEHWYIDEGNFDYAVALNPRWINDYYLSERVRRYARRLNKYGAGSLYRVERIVREEPKEDAENTNNSRVNSGNEGVHDK